MAYKSIHTGQQIDAGVSAALNPDTVPTAGSDALITSGGTKSALNNAYLSIVGFIINGNVSADNIAGGRYVIVQNSTITGIPDGIYQTAKYVPAATPVDATYLTAVADGGLNDIANYVSHNENFILGLTLSNLINTSLPTVFVKNANTVFFCFSTAGGGTLSDGTVLISGIPSHIKPTYVAVAPVYKGSDGKPLNGSVWVEGNGKMTYYGESYTGNVYVSMTYISVES